MAPDLVECEAHRTPTRLRCAEAECGKPICPQCLVKTAVGLKCEEHAQAVAPKFDRRAQRSIIGAVVFVAAAVVILAVAVFNQSSKPAPAPDNTPAPAASGEGGATGRIVPASVFVINVDGTGARTLTNRSLAFDAHPAWSPDGTRIAFESTVDGRRAVWLMQADGQGLRRLTHTTGASTETAPAWSPRGARIAFATDRDGNSEIYVAGADGSGARRLTENPANDGVPSWAPDGARIAFVSDRDGEFGIWAMTADGGSPARLVPGPADPGSKPAWAPDGRTIAFASDRDGANLEIFQAATAAGAGTPTKLITSPGLDGEPAWSADGSRLAFASDRDGSPQIYVANPDGSNVVKVTTRARSYTPAWAPDGRQLAYIYDPAPGG
jgi:Tol biopolymer transport system component